MHDQIRDALAHSKADSTEIRREEREDSTICELRRDVAAISQEPDLLYYDSSLPYFLLDSMNVVTKE